MSLNSESKQKSKLTIIENYKHVEIVSKRVPKSKYESTAVDVFGGVYFQMLLLPLIVDLTYSKIDGMRKFAWDFYKLSNGGVFVAPQTNELFKVKSEIGLQQIPGEAVGLTMTMFIYELIANRSISNLSDKCVELYSKLDQFKAQHPYQLEIYNILNG